LLERNDVIDEAITEPHGVEGAFKAGKGVKSGDCALQKSVEKGVIQNSAQALRSDLLLG
jgi:hypothetical protein